MSLLFRARHRETQGEDRSRTDAFESCCRTGRSRSLLHVVFAVQVCGFSFYFEGPTLIVYSYRHSIRSGHPDPQRSMTLKRAGQLPKIHSGPRVALRMRSVLVTKHYTRRADTSEAEDWLESQPGLVSSLSNWLLNRHTRSAFSPD